MYRPEAEIVPPVADQVTEVLLKPVTVAVNCCVSPVTKEADVGLIVTALFGLLLTCTVAVADFVGSATLVALTVTLPVVDGAVNKPEEETVPALADHVTAVLVVPVTVARNCCVASVIKPTVLGEIDTLIGAATTVTVATAVFVVSAALVAVTVYVPGEAGAV